MVDKNEGPRHESLEVEVFHVDFGSSEWVTVGDVRPLVPKFRTMPGQVVRCQLADLVPVVTDGNAVLSFVHLTIKLQTRACFLFKQESFYFEGLSPECCPRHTKLVA